jgi:enoyl-CoA hydratase/carnithine racemase
MAGTWQNSRTGPSSSWNGSRTPGWRASCSIARTNGTAGTAALPRLSGSARDHPGGQGLKVVISKGAGAVYSSGLDLNFLREVSNGPLLDWDRPTLTIQIAEALRAFPRIVIAQVHGYCLGGALGIVNCHDLVYAAEDAQFGMPEILRGSFGQLVTSTLLHSGLPIKKLAHLALVGRNISGREADALGIISKRFPPSGSRITPSASRGKSPRGVWRRSSITRSPCRWAAICRSRRRSSSTNWSGSVCGTPWIRSTTSSPISSPKKAGRIRATSAPMCDIGPIVRFDIPGRNLHSRMTSATQASAAA